MKPVDLTPLITKYHLQSAAQEIQSLLCESIRLAGKRGSLFRAAAGSSRLGGQPDLPAASDWPALKGKPMSFVAQVRLEDLASFAPAGDLPKAGLLSFFYDADQNTYGDSPQDRGGWQVIFTAPGKALQAIPFPDSLPAQARFKSLLVKFQSEWTLPDSAKQVDPRIQWDDQTEQNYESLLQDFRSASNQKPPLHRMFGWPNQLQDDMQIQAAMMTQGITDVNDPRAKQADQEKAGWQLLLQVDSDDRTGMRWGSTGILYYWINQKDEQARNFGQTWLALQSE